MARVLDADYLVVGAGASGMAFVDALIDHSDARVALVDRRDGVGGHWRAAYPFVRLHQASTFYGVASTLLGGGRIQRDGPEAGLHERADQPTILAYYEALVTGRMAGRVELLAGCDYRDHAEDGEAREVVDLGTGERIEVPPTCRVVDARYLAPLVPSENPPPFAVGEDVRVVAVNDLPTISVAASRYVVVGSGKTATDACVWLLGRGVDPGAICWVRPREPWMLNRAVVQPDPAVFLGMAAGQLEAAAAAASLDDLFVRLEDAGIMLRLDRSVAPTMAKAPTLGTWELELLRSIDDVVRLGHVVSVGRGRIELDEGSVRVADDALVVNCAADGLRNRPLLPIWGPRAITLQPIRAGFPCFGAALAGYVEATRDDDPHADAEKNRLCPPSPLGNTLADWARMSVIGARNAASFGAEPDIAAWAARVPLNPARVPPEHPGSVALDDARARLQAASAPGSARLAELAGLDDPVAG